MENEQYFAYCTCGDALERTGLYPEEAVYHCFGCNKAYRLMLLPDMSDEVEDARQSEGGSTP